MKQEKNLIAKMPATDANGASSITIEKDTEYRVPEKRFPYRTDMCWIPKPMGST